MNVTDKQIECKHPGMVWLGSLNAPWPKNNVVYICQLCGFQAVEEQNKTTTDCKHLNSKTVAYYPSHKPVQTCIDCGYRLNQLYEQTPHSNALEETIKVMSLDEEIEYAKHLTWVYWDWDVNEHAPYEKAKANIKTKVTNRIVNDQGVEMPIHYFPKGAKRIVCCDETGEVLDSFVEDNVTCPKWLALKNPTSTPGDLSHEDGHIYNAIVRAQDNILHSIRPLKATPFSVDNTFTDGRRFYMTKKTFDGLEDRTAERDQVSPKNEGEFFVRFHSNFREWYGYNIHSVVNRGLCWTALPVTLVNTDWVKDEHARNDV
jgi:DNA-directed RNA polymerase subunit RPC12/RpoP